MSWLKALLLVAATTITSAANAAFINSFAQISNDGVWSIDADYAEFLGLTGATHMGAIGIRTTSAQYDIGATFDASSLFNSTNNDASIIGFINGISPGAMYGAGPALGTVTINAFDRDSDRKLFNVAFFGFSTTGNIVFNGTSTFNAGQSRGDFTDILPRAAEVPVPGTLLLLGVGLLAAGAARRR